MHLLAYLSALLVIPSISALHFYFESNEKRCFLEELASDTIVEGHYKALLWNEDNNDWRVDDVMGIHVEVTELSTSHTVVNTRGPPDGRFTFTSHNAGDHNICLHSNITGGWLSTQHIKLYLDINVGSAKHDVEGDLTHVTTLASKVRALNEKVIDIQREQRYMREVEATFRDASELTNTRAVWWSVAQIIVLLAAAVWQMRYLKLYFEDKKLR
ncbi:ER to Golgi transport-related protein [Naematelia encephala]|uniref:ER to Golgi transport-related protein n=1 Tax=Naematelia encephala TaxID=71784 RepID=A0A1Y2AH06_9TREE|nr:ER to Golgi transport-related protein [Naematelia encephala]